MSDSVKEEFDRKIGRLTESKAYLDYCEEVYGYRMYLFNMMDREQLDYLFTRVPVSKDDCILDLGCGSGSLLSALVTKTGCKGIGIDQLIPDLVQKIHPNIQYTAGNIETFPIQDLQLTITLMVDSIYFCRDIEKLILTLSQIKNNRIYIFFSQYLFDGKNNSTSLQKDDTQVANVLKKLHLSYETVDYSMHERLLYERSLTVLAKLKQSFYEEGNGDLFEEKLSEQQLGKQLYDTHNASRYLYII